MAKLSFSRAVAWWSEADGDRPALTCDSRTVTRRQLDERSNRLARAFLRMGVKQKDFVAISLPNSVEFFEAVLATVKIGAAVIPISPKLPAPERDPLLDLVKPALTVGLPVGSYDRAPRLPQDYSCPEELSCDPLPDVIAQPYFATTSGGSTGRPKIIVNRDPGLIDPQAPEGRMTRERAVLIPGPLYHGAPLNMALRALLLGNHVVLMPKFEPETCLRLIDEYRVEYLQVVPTMLNRMWRLGQDIVSRYDLSCLRVLVSFGAACPAWLKEAWIGLIGAENVHEFYTCTERLGRTWISGTEWIEHRGSVGRPDQRGQIKIFGADGREVEPGQVGEIHMMPAAGPGTSYYYIGAESRRRNDGWETVGDLGWFDKDGYLYIADRRTDMIVTGGENVFPAEVEAAIDQHPLVIASAVIGLPDDDLGQRVHAIIQTEKPIEVEALRAWLAARLVRYKIPRTFEFVTEAIRSEAGKVQRSALRKARMGLEPTS